jgi:cholesterol transport system auxiliary component
MGGKSGMRRSAILITALTLAACAGEAPPRDTYYRLDVAQPAAALARPVIPGVLEVGRFDTDGVLSERGLAYEEAGSGGAVALQRYRYALWAEPPGQMLQDKLAQALTDAGAAQKVVTPDLRVPPDWTVRGRLRKFEQLAGQGKVAAEMQLAVVSARDGSLALMNTYASTQATGGDTPEAAAAALGRATSDIFARFLADLGAITIAPPRR